jgi:hypothetical protein
MQLQGSNMKTHRTILWCLWNNGVLHIEMVVNLEKCPLIGRTWYVQWTCSKWEGNWKSS